MKIYSRVMFFFLWNVVIAYFLPTFASFLIRFALRNNC